MSRLDEVTSLSGRRREDDRGWLHVALGASQLPAGTSFGEVYVVRAECEGDRRGDHYHPAMHEWFAVIEGLADLEVVDPATAERRVLRLDAADALTVHVPAGIAHCFVNRTQGPLTVLAWTTAEHDPDDVVAFPTVY